MIPKSVSRESIEGDVEVLAAILEQERRSHCRIRSICLGMFIFSFLLLLCAIGVISYVFVSNVSRDSDGGQTMPMILQILVPLSAAMIGFFASWCAAHGCINSIDRSLYAAQAKKYQLFAGFVGELQCTSRKKRSIWMDMVGSVVG